jgi:hypothetical protein
MILVVPNEANKDPSDGGIMITWKRYIDVTNQ